MSSSNLLNIDWSDEDSDSFDCNESKYEYLVPDFLKSAEKFIQAENDDNNYQTLSGVGRHRGAIELQATAGCEASVNAFPIDIFEQFVNVSMDTELCYQGEVCNKYSAGDLKKKLQMGNDSYLISQKSEGCAFLIKYSSADKVIAGIRVLVGSASLEHVPTWLTCHGQTRETKPSTRRWYEFLFFDHTIYYIP